MTFWQRVRLAYVSRRLDDALIDELTLEKQLARARRVSRHWVREFHRLRQREPKGLQ